MEEQLIQSSQESATEISKLRTTLFEIEMGGGGLDVGAEGMDMDMNMDMDMDGDGNDYNDISLEDDSENVHNSNNKGSNIVMIEERTEDSQDLHTLNNNNNNNNVHNDIPLSSRSDGGRHSARSSFSKERMSANSRSRPVSNSGRVETLVTPLTPGGMGGNSFRSNVY